MGLKLFRIVIIAPRPFYEHYLLAEDANEACKKLKKYLSEKALGSPEQREIENVELIAKDIKDIDFNLSLPMGLLHLDIENPKKAE